MSFSPVHYPRCRRKEEYLPWSKKVFLSLSKEKAKMQMKNNKTYQNAVAFPRKADMAAEIQMLANS